MNSLNPEFRSENEHRKYPLLEDASTSISDSSILDIRGWTRKPVIDPKIHTVSRWDDSGDPAPSVVSGLSSHLQAGYIQIFLELFSGSLLANRVLALNIPVDNVSWPIAVSGQALDPSGVLLVKVVASIGADILVDMPENASLMSNISVPIEPTLIIPIGGQVVDQLRVIHQDSTPEDYLHGKLVLRQGINSRITQRNSVLEFLAEKHAGLGNQLYEGNDRGKCRGVLYVNSSNPDSKGNFFIKGGNGIVITDYPEEHRINIGVVPDSKLIGCSDGE